MFQFIIYYILSVVTLALVGVGIYYTIIKLNYFEGYLFDYYIYMDQNEENHFVKLRIYTPTQVLMNIVNGGTNMPRVGAEDGYCYLNMVPFEEQEKMKKALGKYPTLGRIYTYSDKNNIYLGHFKKHLFKVPDEKNLYHYDKMKKVEKELNLRSEMIVGGFKMSNRNVSWFISTRTFSIMMIVAALLLEYTWVFTMWFFGFRWYTPFYIITSFFIAPGLLYFAYMIFNSMYLNYKIKSIYGDGCDDIATEVHGCYSLKSNVLDEIINENKVNEKKNRLLPTVPFVYQDYLSYPGNLGVRFTQGKKSYVISAPKELQNTFTMLKDYFRLIAHGFEFEITKDTVTTGHDLSSMVNRLIRKTINNEIPAGKRVLHVGENVLAMTREAGHVCCNPQTEPNDANRGTNAINFLNEYNATHELPIEYTTQLFSEITSRFDIVTAIHSVYNQPMLEFFTNCVKVNARTVYVAMHFNPLILSHDHMQMPFSKFIVDQDKRNNIIYFKHDTTDEKSYQHNRKEYFKYLFIDTIKVKYNGLDMYYHRKVIMNCCDVIVFRYDMNSIPPVDNQVENLNMSLADKYIGYYKMRKIDTTFDFITTEYAPEMMFVSTEFETAMKSKQFDKVDRRGYAIETSLSDGKSTRSRVYRFFSKIFNNSDRELDLLASGEHEDNEQELYEIEDYRQISLTSEILTLDAHQFGFDPENDYETTLVANRDVIAVGAGFKTSQNLLSLLVRTDALAQEVKWNNAAETYARQPVCLFVHGDYIVNRKALSMNVRNVIFITCENNTFYRSNYANEEMNHNIGNELDPNVALVEDFNVFYLLAHTQFEFLLEHLFNVFDSPPDLGVSLNTNTLREVMNDARNNGIIIKNGVIYLSDHDQNVIPQMRIYFIKSGNKFLNCNCILDQNDPLFAVLNRMQVKHVREFAL